METHVISQATPFLSKKTGGAAIHSFYVTCVSFLLIVSLNRSSIYQNLAISPRGYALLLTEGQPLFAPTAIRFSLINLANYCYELEPMRCANLSFIFFFFFFFIIIITFFFFSVFFFVFLFFYDQPDHLIFSQQSLNGASMTARVGN